MLCEEPKLSVNQCPSLLVHDFVRYLTSNSFSSETSIYDLFSPLLLLETMHTQTDTNNSPLSTIKRYFYFLIENHEVVNTCAHMLLSTTWPFLTFKASIYYVLDEVNDAQVANIISA